jgi:hypothetical protein
VGEKPRFAITLSSVNSSLLDLTHPSTGGTPGTPPDLELRFAERRSALVTSDIPSWPLGGLGSRMSGCPVASKSLPTNAGVRRALGKYADHPSTNAGDLLVASLSATRRLGAEASNRKSATT